VRIFRYALIAALAIGANIAAANCVLRQSDAAELALGPFVDATDGVTAETGLTISQADVRLKKCAAAGDCGAWAQVSESTSASHDENGWYEKDLDTTDTGTVGILYIAVHESGALPVFLTCYVIETAVFDADYADAASGLRQANVASITDGAVAAADFAAGAIDANAIAANAIGSSELATGAVDADAVAADVSTEFSAAVFTVNATQVSGDSGAADTLETWLDGTTGAASPLGIARQGTAQSATGTTLVLDASAPFADDTAIGMTLVACGSTQGYCQSRTITDYVTATDTATVDTWTVTPSGTITYYLFGTAPGSAGGSLTASDVWSHGTRTLTALDEDTTTLDLNATQVGSVAVFDEDSTTIDINATTIGTVTTATTVSGLAANAITAAATAADFTTEVTSGLATAAALDAVDNFVDTEVAAILDDTGSSGVVIAANAVSAATVAADAGTEIAAAVTAAQGAISGTCDSGSTTTCVDNALTQADATQLEDRLICFDDGWCALITTFTPASDTATTTKVAPSTRASKAYTIFPSTLE
jgi:hypothetical protein